MYVTIIRGNMEFLGGRNMVVLHSGSQMSRDEVFKYLCDSRPRLFPHSFDPRHVEYKSEEVEPGTNTEFYGSSEGYTELIISKEELITYTKCKTNEEHRETN